MDWFLLLETLMVANYNIGRIGMVVSQFPVKNRNWTPAIAAGAAAKSSKPSAPSRDHSWASVKVKPQSWGNPDSLKARFFFSKVYARCTHRNTDPNLLSNWIQFLRVIPASKFSIFFSRGFHRNHITAPIVFLCLVLIPFYRCR